MQATLRHDLPATEYRSSRPQRPRPAQRSSQQPYPRLIDFDLTPDLEAHEPPEARGLQRDHVRLLVSHYADATPDSNIAHTRFDEIAAYLKPGDLLVANDSATLPAALTARRNDETSLALHLSTRLLGTIWVVEPRQATVAAGEILSLPGGGTATMLSPYANSARLWIAQLDLPAPLLTFLGEWGRPIAYPYVPQSWPISMYQTVYAREPGSAEMPSAGRAFSENVLAGLADAGIGFATLTLHTGVASLESHERPYEEPFTVSPATADAVNVARESGRRVIAVGTTVVRALETAADEHGRVIPTRGWTDLVITPEHGVRVVDGLLTGFHEPEASHLDMLLAIAGRDHLAVAYRAAIEGRYLWHEFGDLHLILP